MCIRDRYNVATPILMEALATRAFARILVMVQKEVGRRWAAQPRDELYGAVSVKVAAQADVRVAAQVSRSAFHPVPNVDSVTVRLEPRPWAWPVEREALFRLVEAGFAQRRKRLRNSLSRADLAPAAVEDALERAGLLEEEPYRRGHRVRILDHAIAPLDASLSRSAASISASAIHITVLSRSRSPQAQMSRRMT